MDQALTGMEAIKSQVKSLSELARGLNITRGAIAQWNEVPLKRVVDVSKLTGIPPHVIRPDVFQDPST